MKLATLSVERKLALLDVLEVVVGSGTGTLHRGEVRELTDDSAMVCFPDVAAPELGIGKSITLYFRANQRDLSLEISAVARSRRDNAVSRTYRFDLLVERDRFHAFVIRVLRTLTRGARITTDPATAPRVQLSVSARNLSIEGRLEDIAFGGLGVSIQQIDEWSIAGVSRLRARLQLSPGSAALDLPCTILHRALKGDRVFCGMQVVHRNQAEVAGQLETIRQYIHGCLQNSKAG